MAVFVRNKLFNNEREIRTDKDYICAVILTKTNFKDIEILGIRPSSTNLSLEEYKRSTDVNRAILFTVLSTLFKCDTFNKTSWRKETLQNALPFYLAK